MEKCRTKQSSGNGGSTTLLFELVGHCLLSRPYSDRHLSSFSILSLLILRSLGSLVKKVQESQLQQIVDNLCAFVSQDKEDLREIASIGLKTVIVQVPINSVVAVNVCKRLVPRLLATLENVRRLLVTKLIYFVNPENLQERNRKKKRLGLTAVSSFRLLLAQFKL
jgi:hypothetical protein